MGHFRVDYPLVASLPVLPSARAQCRPAACCIHSHRCCRIPVNGTKLDLLDLDHERGVVGDFDGWPGWVDEVIHRVPGGFWREQRRNQADRAPESHNRGGRGGED
jgi:hypothetical protein